MGTMNQQIFMEWVERGNELFQLIRENIPQVYFLTERWRDNQSEPCKNFNFSKMC